MSAYFLSESDAELRARVGYVCGSEDPHLARFLQVAAGEDLDAIAERFGLRRRRTTMESAGHSVSVDWGYPCTTAFSHRAVV